MRRLDLSSLQSHGRVLSEMTSSVYIVKEIMVFLLQNMFKEPYGDPMQWEV